MLPLLAKSAVKLHIYIIFSLNFFLFWFSDDKIGEFLDGATDGAVVISFGSILQGSQMSDDRKKLFLNVFR